MLAPTRGHLVCGKLMRMRHGLKKKRKYRIGTATAHDIYENQDRPLGDVNCDATKAALAEAARRRVAAAEQQQQPQQAPAEGAVLKTKKIVKRVVKKKVSR
ncbi:hypothetical protein DIPPA_32035 [Diplonema papillatum]|nr:hypothetical protein DIPPA_32035 [Diplonema papillatum]